MSDSDEADRVNRLRALAEGFVGRAREAPAVQTLTSVLATYDAAGGGLVAGGLAYSALLALLPGLLLVLSVVALIVNDPGVRDQIVTLIAQAVPPLHDVARTALEQVSAGAAPTGIVALVGLVWGSSRFYASLDTAMSRVFRSAPRRNAVVQTVRGVLVSVLLVATPVAALIGGSMLSWLLDLAPAGVEIQGLVRGVLQIVAPFTSFVVFVLGTTVVYRFVPARHVSMWALMPPAVSVGLVLAIIAQVFTFLAPRLAGTAALFGAFVAVFTVLAWLSISFNVLLLGACWTRVRLLAASAPQPA